ncbi:MAG: winged helix-turn-helix domain-containing protein [Elusimicrobia bacterium]|nr:winged helix-turn-helix domain-containing protein [Elusimicrobiota bacterium]
MQLKLLIFSEDASGEQKSLKSAVAVPAAFLVRLEDHAREAMLCAQEWKPHGMVLCTAQIESSIQICRELRTDERTKNIAVLILSSDQREEKVIEALQSGADEYLFKPYHSRELFWRIYTVLRRAQSVETSSSMLQSDLISIDKESGRVWSCGKEIKLTRTEFSILEILVRSKGRAVTRLFLLEAVRGYEPKTSLQAIDLYISRLRKKIGPRAGKYIQTLYGIGYAFRPPS